MHTQQQHNVLFRRFHRPTLRSHSVRPHRAPRSRCQNLVFRSDTGAVEKAMPSLTLCDLLFKFGKPARPAFACCRHGGDLRSGILEDRGFSIDTPHGNFQGIRTSSEEILAVSGGRTHCCMHSGVLWDLDYSVSWKLSLAMLSELINIS